MPFAPPGHGEDWVQNGNVDSRRLFTARPLRLVRLDQELNADRSPRTYRANLSWSSAEGEVNVVAVEDGDVSHSSGEEEQEESCWALPYGLAHPHVHLDKCYLLNHPSCHPAAHNATVNSGGGGDASSFQDALKKTSEAKSRFTMPDLLHRGRRLLRESLLAGVTAARCHVEVDPTVGLLCLEAGLQLQEEFQGKLEVRLAVFAQDPIFSYDDDNNNASKMQSLLREAARRTGVSCIGSAPYVEADRDRAERNVNFVFELAEENGLDLDFHSDYDLSSDTGGATIWYILDKFRKVTDATVGSGRMSRRRRCARWQVDQRRPARLALGHCTRVSNFSPDELARLSSIAADLDVYFIGLPTSDVYIQGREHPWTSRPRGTLPLLELRKSYNISCAVGLNNVGNLFTPQACADPLVGLVLLLVALYQTAALEDLGLILSMLTRDAHEAIGSSAAGAASPWQSCLLLPSNSSNAFAELVLNPPLNRITVTDGKVVSRRRLDDMILD